MNVTINPARVGVSIDSADLNVSTGDPVARYVVEPYITVEETEEGAEFTVTAQGVTTRATARNGQQGQQGPPGPRGEKGETGSTGERGPAGETGQTGERGPAGERGPQGERGPAGSDGSDGVTFTPSVDVDGVISWTNDGGRDNPASVNIRGPQGERGPAGETGPAGAAGAPGATGTTFTPSVNENGDLSWTNDGGKPNPATVNIKGPQGPQGETGPAGTTDYNDLQNKPTIPTKTSDLTNDSGYITGMTILSYGHSAWNDFLAAYKANKVVYCRASSNSNPATGSQTRMAFMAYVNNADNPTNVEFQYYRSVSSHSASQQGDQVYIYKLDKNSGWSVTVREAYTKIVVGTGLTSSYSNGVLTISLA